MIRCQAASGCRLGNEAMSELKKIKRVLEVTATVIAVALVIIEKFDKAS